jgi:transcription antitermination protein NusB
MKASLRKARALALQVLFEIDTAGHDPGDVLTRIESEEKLSEENFTFVNDLVMGVVQNREKIDAQIKKYAPAWPLQQMPVVDRNILRLAIFEILQDNKVPIKVAINEAIELAKKFGSDNSSKFVNGVLGAVSALAENRR